MPAPTSEKQTASVICVTVMVICTLVLIANVIGLVAGGAGIASGLLAGNAIALWMINR